MAAIRYIQGLDFTTYNVLIINRYVTGAAVGSGPITLEIAKAYLQQEASYTRDDAIIQVLIDSAQGQFENHTKQLLQERAYIAYTSLWSQCYELKHDVKTFTSLEYVDADGATQTIPTANYEVVNGSSPTMIKMIDWEYPATTEIIFTYSVGDVAGVDKGIIGLLLYMIRQQYDRRDDGPAAKPTVSMVQMERYKKHRY